MKYWPNRDGPRIRPFAVARTDGSFWTQALGLMAVAVLVVGCLGGQSSVETGETVYAQGIVWHKEVKPIEGAKVVTRPDVQVVYTNDEGYFMITEPLVAEGPYTFVVTKDGTTGELREVIATNGSVLDEQGNLDTLLIDMETKGTLTTHMDVLQDSGVVNGDGHVRTLGDQ